MRKHGLLLSLLAAWTIASASTYHYEFTPLIGGVWNEGSLGYENRTPTLFGGEIQFNNLGYALKPELSLSYTPGVGYENSTLETDIYRIALNGVYAFDKYGQSLPFAKLGVGYETMDAHLYDNRDSAFADLGAGINIPLSKQIALKLEAIYMVKYNGERIRNTQHTTDRWDVTIAALAGVSFAFGESTPKPLITKAAIEQEAPKTVEPAPVIIPKDSDNDGIVDASDQCAATPSGVIIDTYGCAIDSDEDGVADHIDVCINTPKGTKIKPDGCPLDRDGDGVADSFDRCSFTPSNIAVDTHGCPLDNDNDDVADYEDKCLGTPQGFKVDTQGCPVKLTLSLTYEFSSDRVDAASLFEVEMFALFLQESPAYKLHITGHTDNIGAIRQNQILSERRARSLRRLLIYNGINAQRISIEGKGELSPIASNATQKGRDANRRIEVELIR